jgi:fimbrial chaperone protein
MKYFYLWVRLLFVALFFQPHSLKGASRSFDSQVNNQKKWVWCRRPVYPSPIKNIKYNINYSIFFMLLTLFLKITLFCSASYASSIQITPIRLQILPHQKTASMDIYNNSADSVVIQLSIVKWNYINGKDVYEDTKNILVTPPIAIIQPQEKQIVRLGMIAPPDAQKGGTYRLIVKEVPSPTFEPAMGVQTLLEIRVPVVVAPLTPSKPQMSWTVNRAGEKKLNITWQNTGESYISLRKIALFDKDEEKPLTEHDYQAFLLPTQKQEFVFELPDSFKGNDIKIVAETDAGEISEIVPIVSP